MSRGHMVIGTVYVFSHLDQLNFSGIFSLTITTSPEINVSLGSNSSIVLNCTFEFDANEAVRNVYWRKKLHGTDYNNLAEYFHKLAIYNKVPGLSLENRSTLHSFSDTSQSAILNITDVRCEDVGHYQCEVAFSVGSTGETDQKYTDVYLQGIHYFNIFNIVHAVFIIIIISEIKFPLRELLNKLPDNVIYGNVIVYIVGLRMFN